MKKEETNFRKMMAEAKFFEAYSRYKDDTKSYETWNESIFRVMNMHKKFYSSKMTPELLKYIDMVEESYNQKDFLGAQRALQFGGDQILKHNARLYNCTASYADRPSFFGESFYMMLCGCGVGFSVQKHHIDRLPALSRRTKPAKTFKVQDSIEGWAKAIDVLLSSFFVDGGKHPEYKGNRIYFDLEDIRAKGSFISGGFNAPGPDPLRKTLDLVENLIKSVLRESEEQITRLKPIDAYDIVMYIADAVISGGVRRAATICLFSIDDELMMSSKTGNWFAENPQRGRSNNSVVLVRKDINLDILNGIVDKIKAFGEPGFIFVEDKDVCVNPCAEIALYPQTEEGLSGWQVCNLTEINGAKTKTPEIFYTQCKVASIMGTLQAGYTDFKFLGETSKAIIEKEALIGVGITGFMNNPKTLFDEEVLKKGAEIVKLYNKVISELIGINQAARCTTVKPSGTASVLLGTTSGIHGEHSKRYIRNVQFNKDTEIAKLFKDTNPCMVEDSIWSTSNSDYVVSFPIVSPKDSIFKNELIGVKQLEYVKKAQINWIEHGTNVDLCTKPYLRHNVSNTITVDNWDEVIKYVYDNKDCFCGVSFMPEYGDKNSPQSPFTEVLSMKEITKKYGDESLLTSAIIEAALNAFNYNLWLACDTALGLSSGLDISAEDSANVLQRDFVRRFSKFSLNFKSPNDCSDCLKDVYLFHKWWKIQHSTKDINFDRLSEKTFTDVDSLGAQACSGGACELVW